MIYLVEGLNGAGKSTWIKKQCQAYAPDTEIVETPWANPRRFGLGSFKHYLKLDQVALDAYLFGVWESLLHQYKDSDRYVYFDRSWISCYVYGSISEKVFIELANIWKDLDVTIVYVFSNKAEDRFRLQTDKDYVDEGAEWRKTHYKFDSAFCDLKDHLNYKVEFASGDKE